MDRLMEGVNGVTAGASGVLHAIGWCIAIVVGISLTVRLAQARGWL